MHGYKSNYITYNIFLHLSFCTTVLVVNAYIGLTFREMPNQTILFQVAGHDIPDYMLSSIITTIFINLFLGIIAIVYSSKVIDFDTMVFLQASTQAPCKESRLKICVKLRQLTKQILCTVRIRLEELALTLLIPWVDCVNLEARYAYLKISAYT